MAEVPDHDTTKLQAIATEGAIPPCRCTRQCLFGDGRAGLHWKQTDAPIRMRPVHAPQAGKRQGFREGSRQMAADRMALAPEPAGEQPSPRRPVAMVSQPTYEQITALAYELWERRGRPPGDGREDWLEAERQLREQHSALRATPRPVISGPRYHRRSQPFHLSRRVMFLLQNSRCAAFRPRRAWHPLRMMPLV